MDGKMTRQKSVDKSENSDLHTNSQVGSSDSKGLEYYGNGGIGNSSSPLLANPSHSHSHQSKSSSEEHSIFTMRALLCIALWYLFSFTTLFLNKYIVTYEKGDATMLGTFQMLFCAICGYFHSHFPLCMFKVTPTHTTKKSEKFSFKLSNFTRSLLLVGTLRFSTILLGLIALWYVPVSFAETIKSSAPVFTVFIAKWILGEETSLLVNLSLIPVMSGLALCSAYELSFTLPGFIASLATNLSECLQNVFSKRLLSVEHYEPAHLQFYTSLSSFLIQIPCILFLVDLPQFMHAIFTDKNMLLTFVLAGISFHCQSFTEYMLLSLISPVTHSVANTAKRALLIWLSVLTFGNSVTFLSWVGTALVILGVLFYNKARQVSVRKGKIPVKLMKPFYKIHQSEAHEV